VALSFPTMGAFKTIPTVQKLAIVSMVLIGIAALFYYYIENPQQEVLTQLTAEIGRLDQDIQINKAKTRSLEDLKRVNAELEQQLAKNQEQLPPEDEAATLLKQISDLGIRIGLNFKLWKPGARAEDSSKLFVRMPVDVEINVSKIKMGGGKTERGRVSIQTTFELTAFASPRTASAAPAKADGK